MWMRQTDCRQACAEFDKPYGGCSTARCTAGFCSRRCKRRLGLLDSCVLDRHRCLNIFKRQLDLIGIKPLGGAPELGPSQHSDDVIEAFVLSREPINFRRLNLTFVGEALPL